MIGSALAQHHHRRESSVPQAQVVTESVLQMELSLQKFIERDLGISFLADRNFYENLESGQLLCRLVANRGLLSSGNINEFDKEGDSLRENYTRKAKQNIELFVAICRDPPIAVSAPAFSFSDLYMQKNKDAICKFLIEVQTSLVSIDEQAKQQEFAAASAPPVELSTDQVEDEFVFVEKEPPAKEQLQEYEQRASPTIVVPQPVAQAQALRRVAAAIPGASTGTPGTPTSISTKRLDSVFEEQSPSTGPVSLFGKLLGNIAVKQIRKKRSPQQDKTQSSSPLSPSVSEADQSSLQDQFAQMSFSNILKVIVQVYLLPLIVIGVVVFRWKPHSSQSK